MPTISGRQALAANATVANVLLGSQYELAPFDGTIEIGMMGSQNDATCMVFSGPDVLQEPGGIIPFSGTAGLVVAPKYPDDYHWEDEVAKGDRLKITLTSVTALTIVWSLRMAPA